MRLKSIMAAFLHCPPGHHQAFNFWHDNDHRPENHGVIPHIYHSQRWVAPPEYVAARGAVDPTAFPKGGGEYLATYWSTATPEQLLYDMTVLREQLTVVGRCGAINRDFEGLWVARMHFVAAQTREGLPLSADAVPLAPHKGILVSIGEIIDKRAGEEWANWYMTVHVNDVLRCKGYRAFFKFMPMREQDQHIYLHMYYLDEDPLEALKEARSQTPRLKAEGRYPEDLIKAARRDWMISAYRPIIPGQYDFYD